MPTYLSQLFDLPRQVRQGDFVLKLTDGVQHPETTLRDYVVTPSLAGSFDAALGMIGDAIRGKASKGAYLHGSFGTGKSHFMVQLRIKISQVQ
jgi:predicted ATPase